MIYIFGQLDTTSMWEGLSPKREEGEEEKIVWTDMDMIIIEFECRCLLYDVRSLYIPGKVHLMLEYEIC